MGAERQRILENEASTSPWHRWGPFLSERQWGTVREDYSSDGDAWDYFPHDHARSRTYRWGEDGLFGFCDRHEHLCFALALWNGRDPYLKERLFGLTNQQGNHGEDVKECYYYLDATPSHAYQRALYRYPQAAFPYDGLIRENANRDKQEGEYELVDTGIFDQNRYFDVVVEYAKGGPDEIYVRIAATNQGPEAATLILLPQLWFRNRWSWMPESPKPRLWFEEDRIRIDHLRYGEMELAFSGEPAILFTENETNYERIFGTPNVSPYVKDAFHRTIVNGEDGAINPDRTGTKAGLRYGFDLAPGETKSVCLRMQPADGQSEPFSEDLVIRIMQARRDEADAFYAELSPSVPEDIAKIQRQAFAGLLWSKQFYHYDVSAWLDGDPSQPTPPASRLQGRNHEWRNFHAAEVLSIPDSWEYPWFAAWDLGFHCIPLALIDPTFAKKQLLLLLREWYTHPNGQMPAYEWAFGDVNPPVHAWAGWRVYTIERRMTGIGDRDFLERLFHKLLINFTWWVNRKDAQGNNVFEGGFLGLDNIGVFDRNARLPDGSHIEQSDGTSWMAMFCLNMLTIALELAREEPSYEDVASKFLEHFFYIAKAMNSIGDENTPLWDDEDGFYYDVLCRPDVGATRLKVRSMVGLIPLLAVANLDADVVQRFPAFWARMEWFLRHRPEMIANVASVDAPGYGERRVLSLVGKERLARILARMLDPNEFLSPYGIRSLSRDHGVHPYTLRLDGQTFTIDYEPGESSSGTFGGNSNWRGPIWFPLNYLLIEALQRMDYYYDSNFMVEMPTGSENSVTLATVAEDLECRLLALFKVQEGVRPSMAGEMSEPVEGEVPLLLHEYFHGETGKGLGASHQSGWTALIAKIIQQVYVTLPDRRDA